MCHNNERPKNIMIMKKNVPWNLIIPKLKQEISIDEELQLKTWLLNSNNEALFKELQLLWEKIQTNGENYTPDTEFYWNELVNRMHIVEYKQKEDKSAKINFELKRVYRYAVAACIAITIGCSFYIGFLKGYTEPVAQLYTNLSGKSKVLLPDGSEVWMHSETALQYNSKMNENERKVSVTGEAYFDVKHDAEKPFVVQTEGLRIIVHGTKFNVNAFPSSENTLVSLVEGSVSLETQTESRFLQPGETAIYNRNTQKLKIEKDDVVFASSWANNKFVFKNRSLGDICKLLSKWYRIKIDLDPALSNRYFYTFTLRSEPLDEILRIMSRIKPMKYSFNEKNELTISSVESK